MLTVWEAPVTRPTLDIDLLGRIDNSIETIGRELADERFAGT
jgi:hypothetical protein